MSSNGGVIASTSARSESDVRDLEEFDTIDGSESEESETNELPMDVIFELLKNQRRRHLLRYLKHQEGPVALGELAEHVAALENGTSVNALTSGQRKRVYVGLYQCHLPKMDDAGVIRFNRDRGLIERDESAVQLEEYLEEEDEEARPWHAYYLGLSVGGGAIYGASALALSPAHPLTTAIVLGLLLTVGTISVLHHRHDVSEAE